MFRSRQTLLQSNIFRKSTPATIRGNNEREGHDLFLGLSLCICIFIWVCISVALFLFANNIFIHICIGMNTLSPVPKNYQEIKCKLPIEYMQSEVHWIEFENLGAWPFNFETHFDRKNYILTVSFDISHRSSQSRSYHGNYCRQRQSLRSLSLLSARPKKKNNFDWFPRWTLVLALANFTVAVLYFVICIFYSLFSNSAFLPSCCILTRVLKWF